MRKDPKNKDTLVRQIVSQDIRRFSTAAVLFHHAIAERLGLGPTDHKCLDLLRERGLMTASELAAITGLTTGAVTGVVARLEHGGYLRREPDPHDGRKQVLHPKPERERDIRNIFYTLHNELSAMVEKFDSRQLAAIAEFLSNSTKLVYRHAAVLRAEALCSPSADRSAEEK